MLCCTSAPPTTWMSGSRDSTGQANGATKQTCIELAGGSCGPVRRARAHAVHHADGEPEEHELERRPQARSGEAGGEEAEQPGHRALEEAAQRRAEIGVAAERERALPDVPEVGEEQRHADRAHVEPGL